MQLLAESLGACALVINFIGYRQNDVNRYRLISGFALVFLSSHFFLLDAMAAGVGCGLAAVRNFIAMRYRHQGILVFFVALNVGFLLWEWFWLDHPWIILFAYSSALIFTVGSIILQDANRIRQWFVLAEGLGLVYGLLVGSIFGSLFSTTNLLSILIKLYQERSWVARSGQYPDAKARKASTNNQQTRQQEP